MRLLVSFIESTFVLRLISAKCHGIKQHARLRSTVITSFLTLYTQRRIFSVNFHDDGWLWIPGGYLKRSFREKLVEGFQKDTQVIVSSLLYQESSTALCLSPSILPLCPATSPQPHMACLLHAPHTQHTASQHRSLHTQAHMLFGGHCPPTPPFIPVTFWSLKLSFPRPGLLRVHHGGEVHCPPAQEHPRTAACPRANVPAPPTSPQPLLPAYSAITPTSVSHFPRAPLLTSLSSWEMTLSMGISKKKEKEGRGGKMPGASLDAARRVLHSQGHERGLREAAAFFTISWFLSEPCPVGAWCSSLLAAFAWAGVWEPCASVRDCLVRQWLSW